MPSTTIRCAIAIVGTFVLGVRGSSYQQPAAPSRWTRIYVTDAFVRDAVARALDAAAERLQTPRCQSLVSEFRDARGRPLGANLSALGVTVEDYLHLLVFMDGETNPRCREEGVMAFTATASRVIYVCGPAFRRGASRDVTIVRATVIR